MASKRLRNQTILEQDYIRAKPNLPNLNPTHPRAYRYELHILAALSHQIVQSPQADLAPKLETNHASNASDVPRSSTSACNFLMSSWSGNAKERKQNEFNIISFFLIFSCLFRISS